MVVGCIKAYCGYWRPYFLEECGFDDATGRCASEDYGHGFRFFPSGHASNSVGPTPATQAIFTKLKAGETVYLAGELPKTL